MPEQNQNEKQFLTEKEAMLRWRASRQTMWRMRKDGLPFYRMNSTILYDPAEVEAFIKRNARSAVASA